MAGNDTTALTFLNYSIQISFLDFSHEPIKNNS